MLSGEYPNSLGRTVEVVERVLQDKMQLEPLFDCYESTDPLVRLRTSNALERICRVQPEWLRPYVDRLIQQVSRIDQASAQWTLATLFLLLEPGMQAAQKQAARRIHKDNLGASQRLDRAKHDDGNAGRLGCERRAAKKLAAAAVTASRRRQKGVRGEKSS